MSTWVLSPQGNLDWLDHPAFNWVNTMIGNVKKWAPAVTGSGPLFWVEHGSLSGFQIRVLD